jgi:membrane associated rhomboid family serine protease
MLQNLPQVTKNILLLNVMFFLVTLVLQFQGINLIPKLGAHYVNSPLFEPFQVVTYFFMHGGFLHIFFNMWIFIMLGGYLERIWGPQRFFIFYIACAIGGFALYNILGVYEINQLKQFLVNKVPLDSYNNYLKTIEVVSTESIEQALIDFASEYQITPDEKIFHALYAYSAKSLTPMVGASGAIFGVMGAFAILFPNTEFLLYFAIPVKAKYLVGGYILLELYLSFQDNPTDNTAHLAHVGGAVVGAIIVLFWRKKDRNNFW